MDLLLVEDDLVTSEVLSLMLAGDRWQVTVTHSGEAALAHLQNTLPLPALILCDQKLPGVCGPSLAEAIRSVYRKAGNAPLVLLAMSASRGPLPTGYDSLLLKPFSATEVRSVFEAVQHGGHARREPGESEFPEPKAWEAQPIIDLSVFAKLQASMGAERLRDLYSFAITDAADRVRRMQSASLSGDELEFARQAHMLKGAAGMIGARQLAAQAQYFEAHLPDSDTTEFFRTKLAMLTAALDDIEHMLEKHFPART